MESSVSESLHRRMFTVENARADESENQGPQNTNMKGPGILNGHERSYRVERNVCHGNLRS